MLFFKTLLSAHFAAQKVVCVKTLSISQQVTAKEINCAKKRPKQPGEEHSSQRAKTGAMTETTMPTCEQH